MSPRLPNVFAVRLRDPEQPLRPQLGEVLEQRFETPAAAARFIVENDLLFKARVVQAGTNPEIFFGLGGMEIFEVQRVLGPAYDAAQKARGDAA